MIPEDIRLFTWLDVEEVLWRIEQEDWPSWLLGAQAYWDALTLYIKPNHKDEAINWLNDKYSPRFSQNNIILEDSPKGQRLLPVIIRESDGEEHYQLRVVPTFSRPTILMPTTKPAPSPLPRDLPPVIAFHSFKGGVGRTIHAVALARALSRNKGGRVLLIDADLEAPGITWLIRDRLPNPPISFSDFLALVHGEDDPAAESSLSLLVDRLQNACLDGIYVLPAFRSDRQFSSLVIRPETVIEGAEDPYCLTHLCARLGKTLGVNAVIIDLRAGLSEMAAGFLLDPRIYRILVTTLSGQSVQGTKLILDLLSRMAPSRRDDHPIPAIIVAQILEDHRHGGLVDKVEQELLKTLETVIHNENNSEIGQENFEFPIIETSFDRDLTAIPTSWEEVIDCIERLIKELYPIVEIIPSIETHFIDTDKNKNQIYDNRKKLKNLAEKMVYAEKGEGENLLAIKALKRLASDHRKELPIVVVVGAKGAGKTYTFLQCVRKKTWGEFVRSVGITEIEPNIRIFPFLASKNLSGLAEEFVDIARKETLAELGANNAWNEIKIRDYIGNRLNQKELLSEPEWRELWLDLMAWALGFRPGVNGVGQKLPEFLSKQQKKIVFIIDGLEDTFQELSNNEVQRTALRVLLQDVPKWLKQQPSRSLGLIIFVRRDMVHTAIPQNAAQLMSIYEPYALKWSPEEALRLVAWISCNANVLSVNYDLSEISQQKLEETLIPLWGRKLGHDHSKEARTSEWVIAALSDFRGQIQARDLVRLIFRAAYYSLEEKEYWFDRILAPSALKKALPDCSKEKIKEIKEENPLLKIIFENLSALKSDMKQIPFDLDNLEKINLSYEDIKVLEDNGVVLREKDEYYMPEIFRLGLGFQLSRGARPKVLYLARRARKQFSI